MFKIIAAVSDNGVIGVGDDLPWKIPADLKKFKELTMNQKCLMGSKTYDSMKKYFKGEVLPGREKFVLSTDTSKHFDNAVTVSLDDALKLGAESDVFIIGGGTVYNMFFELANDLYLTRVRTNLINTSQNVTLFPKAIGAMEGFKIHDITVLPDATFCVDFCHYVKVPQ